MSGSSTVGGTYLTLDLWHPDCWAIQATERHPGGVLAHAVYDTPVSGSTTVNGLFTAYGGSEAEVEQIVADIESSPLTESLTELHTSFDTRRRRLAAGSVSREFFLEHDPSDMVCPTLLEHGFVHSGPCKIEDGRESWEVRYVGARSEIPAALESVCEEAGAEIEIESIGTDGGGTGLERRIDSLTTRQREVLDLARERGYYRWPRETSTRELASDLGIAKTTLLEHLRRAEAKLLDAR